MKKILFVSFSTVLIVTGAVSCKKTSLRKIANEWEVSKLSSEYIINSDGYNSVTTNSMEREIWTQNIVKTSGSSTTTIKNTAFVTKMNYTFEKDGSFKIISDITWNFDTMGGATSTRRVKEISSGTWSFLKENKSNEFKKNERVVLNTLSKEYVESISNSSNISSNVYSYAEGENSTIYVVIESKNKELQLEAETKASNSSSYIADPIEESSFWTHKGLVSITLTQE